MARCRLRAVHPPAGARWIWDALPVANRASVGPDCLSPARSGLRVSCPGHLALNRRWIRRNFHRGQTKHEATFDSELPPAVMRIERLRFHTNEVNRGVITPHDRISFV